jgi:hypothetical protein
VRKKGELPGPPPPVVPHPESLAAQAAYPFGHSAIAQVSLGPNCFQALGSSPGLLQCQVQHNNRYVTVGSHRLGYA